MKKIIKVSIVFLLAISLTDLKAQTTGTVFRDYNGNGTRQTVSPDLEPLVAGIIVNAYNSSDLQVASYTTTSAAAPNFSIPLTGSTYNGTPGSNTGSVNTGVAVRLEFIIPASGACGLNPNIDYSTGNGSTVGSSVRFITGGATAVNYAIHNPAEYKGATTDPLTFTSRFSNGDPNITGAGNAGNLNTFLGFPFSNTGTTAPSRTMTANNMGSVWGLAYSRRADRMFAAAYVKRHWGLKGSSGQVFSITNLSSGTITATDFFDFDKGIDNVAGNADDIPTRYNGSVGAITYGTAGHYTITGTAPIQTITFNGSTDPVSGLPAGLGVIGTNTNRGLTGPTNNVSNDPAAFGQVGRVGLGDIEISDDGLFLYVVNLYDRKLYRLTLNSATNPTAVTAVTSYILPTPPPRSSKGGGFATTYAAATTNFYTGAAGGGYQRPFGLKFWRGKVYVGAVTSGETGGTSTKDNNTGNPEYTDLWAYVWEFDAATAAFNSSPLLQEPQNFNRGINGDGKDESWNPWTNTFQGYVTTGSQPADSRYYYYAQPMLTGIEFDNDGSMILGFRDRFGDQSGYDQPPLTGLGTGFNGGVPNLSLAIDGIATGDILRAYRNPAGCGFVMETNGTAGLITTAGAMPGAINGGQGPSNYTGNNGEFYYQDGIERFNGGGGDLNYWHLNCPEGALAMLPGDASIATTIVDPLALFSNGISKMSNVNGGNPSDYQLTGTTSRAAMGKAAALGDLEFLLPNAPLEFGNRIWNDVDGDGIQEAGEANIANVSLEIFVDNNNDGVPDGAAIGTTITNASGEWYFNTGNITGDGDPITAGTQAAITPGIRYIIRPAAADWTGGAGTGDLLNFRLTAADITGNGAVDVSDNDATINGSGASAVPQISVLAGLPGQNNHNLDFGFKQLASIGEKVWLDMGAGGGIANNGIQEATEPGVAGVTVMLYRSSDATIGNGDDVLISTTVTDAYGNYLFENLTPQSGYYVKVLPPANYVFSPETNANDNTSLTGGSTAANGSDVNQSGALAGYTDLITLSNAETDLRVDAGLVFSQPTTNSIGDRVWLDIDGNNLQNGTEPGVAGVTVTLFNNAGAVAATTITDANGNYNFTNLPDGNYRVGFTLPAGFTYLTKGGDNTSGGAGDSGTDSDVNTTGVNFGRTDLIDLDAASAIASGVNYTNVDAGLRTTTNTTASIGDFVWNDLDQDGIQDAGEPGIGGVTVTIYASDGTTVIATTVTDAFGAYIFTGLPGGVSYVIGITVPAGYTVSPQNVGSDLADNDINSVTFKTNPILLPNGIRNMSVDAGLYQTSPAGTARFGNQVWFDNGIGGGTSGNGIKDGTEPGAAGVTVELLDGTGNPVDPDGAGPLTRTLTSTDANGNYQFVNLAAGNYTVQFSNLPPGYTFTQRTGTADNQVDNNSDANRVTGRSPIINLGAGESDQTVDAGLIAGQPAGTGSLGNRVWYDLPGGTNGVQDAGETGIAGITVNLYLDANNDGSITGAEQTSIATQITNSLGEYLFTGLNTGAYQIGFSTLSAGYNLSPKDVVTGGGNDLNDSDGNTLGAAVAGNTAVAGRSLTDLISLAQGEDNLSIDFGMVKSSATTGSISDRVWFDVNSDGDRDNATEPGIAGVTVTLYDAAGLVLAVTTTDANGYYLFDNLAAATYSVGFSNYPAGLTPTNQTPALTNDFSAANGAGRTAPVTLSAGQNRTDVDFGLRSIRASLGNFVWLDNNGDGVQNAGEPGIAGVTVLLYFDSNNDGDFLDAGENVPVTSMITDQNGQYLFTNLNPGNYQVELTTVPAGLNFTQQNTPGDNGNNTNSDADLSGRTGTVNLSAGEADLTVDAGLYKPIASVGNYVWADNNSNSTQDASDQGVAGVLVTLYTSGGVPVSTTVTDRNGAYLFNNVPPGNYYMGFANTPNGSLFVIADQGGNDALDSDVNNTNGAGTTATFNVPQASVTITIDAGLVYSQTLPVQLQFMAYKRSTASELLWIVNGDITDVKEYVIERSADGRNYTVISSLQADTRTNYQQLDVQPLNGINYYRIRIEYIDGKIEYSAVRIIRFGNDGIITIFPNPAINTVNISLPDSWQGKRVTIEIINQLGQVVNRKAENLASQVESIDISKLSSGIYTVYLSNTNGEIAVRRLLVK